MLHFATPFNGRVRSPASLVRPEAQIVSFLGRETVMSQLRDWCVNEEQPVDIAVITGPGGQGKTRLGQELVSYYQERGWVSGFLRPDPEAPVSLYATLPQ